MVVIYLDSFCCRVKTKLFYSTCYYGMLVLIPNRIFLVYSYLQYHTQFLLQLSRITHFTFCNPICQYYTLAPYFDHFSWTDEGRYNSHHILLSLHTTHSVCFEVFTHIKKTCKFLIINMLSPLQNKLLIFRSISMIYIYICERGKKNEISATTLNVPSSKNLQYVGKTI